MYCANCDNEAVCITSNNKTPLCASCREAFEWGQNSPDAYFNDVPDEDEEEDED